MWGAIGGALLGGIGKLFSGGSKGSEDSRMDANQMALVRDRTRVDEAGQYERALQERAAIDMKQREADAAARTGGYRQALHAQRMQNWQPAQRPNGVPMVRGGFNTIPQASRDLAAKFEQDALVKALQGEKFNALPPIQRVQASPMKEASLWEKMSGAIGLGLSGASLLQKRGPMDEIPDPDGGGGL